jgi:PAS domain S-box-containing protein
MATVAQTGWPARWRAEQRWLPYSVAVIALLVAVVAAYYARTAAEARAQLRFQGQVANTMDRIGRRVAAHGAMLRAGTALFAATGHLTRAEFAAYVERLDLAQEYPGIQGVGLSLRVEPAARGALEADMRREGFPEFKIWPAGPRQEYYTIVYLEPLDRRNAAAIGYDMFTEPVRRAAMERARDSGLPAASGRVTLVQEIDVDKQPGFLIYVPIYRAGRMPATVAERRDALAGFLYSPLRAGDFFEGSLGGTSRPFLEWSVYDGETPSPEHLLHHWQSSSRPSRWSWGRFTTTTEMRVAGEPLTLVFTSGPDSELAWEYGIVGAILTGGLMMSGLLFLVVRAQLRARLIAEASGRQVLQTQERFRRMADTAPVLVWLAGPDKLHTFFNRGWLTFTGRGLDEELGSGWFDGIHPDDRTAYLDTYNRAFDRREPFEIEYRLRRADGTYRWVLVRGVPLVGRERGFAGYIGACVDIEDRKRAEVDRERMLSRERTSRRQAEELAAVSRALNETLDLPRLGEVIVRSVLALTGLQAALLYRADARSGDLTVVACAGDTGADLVPGMVIPAGTATIGRAARERRPIATPNFLEDPDVHIMTGLRDRLARAPYRSVLALPLIAHDVVIGALALGDRPGRAFTGDEVQLAGAFASQAAVALENARLLQEAETARVNAEAANQAKDEFLATVSHELRTPLNAVLGWSRMLASGALDPGESARALDAVQRNAIAQAQIIDDLLDVSRIARGKLRLDLRPLNPVAVVEAALDSVRPAAAAKGVLMETRLDRDVGTVSGDPDRLQQVVWNLLANAVKFTPKGGRVEIHLQRDGADVEILVRDTGEGIRADLLPHIFERFRQAEGGSTRARGGLGIGLALVRYLVELHGGTVEAMSAGEGKGATFSVRLPLRLETSASVGDLLPRFTEHAGVTTAGRTLAGLRVLAVDDHRDSLELISALLVPQGAEVRTAMSADDALKVMGEWPVDIVLSDIEMPGEDGYSLIRRIRALPRDRGGAVPAVAITAYGRMEDRIRSLASGYQQYLAKPMEPAELITIIATLTRGQTFTS